MFGYLILLNIWINFDHGVLPACAVAIQEDLDLSNKAFGGLGSIVFIGLTLGKFLLNKHLNELILRPFCFV